MKKLILFIISFFIFSFWIYIFKNYFLWTSENYLNIHIEDTYIEPVIVTEDLNSWSEWIKNTNNYKLTTNEVDNIDKRVVFSYFPISFEKDVLDYSNWFKSFLFSLIIKDKIDYLNVEMHKDKSWVRWNMKNRHIKLFWLQQMGVSETLAVWIHEFGHFIDLYYLKKQLFTDVSDYFYNISWISVNVIKPGQVSGDFVSGYAMTNKYEDFAESFIYFVLHNKDFLEKSKKSTILKSKYDFFTKYLFKNKEFDNSNFSDEKIKPYYRDITKINFSLQNFLEFLKK